MLSIQERAIRKNYLQLIKLLGMTQGDQEEGKEGRESDNTKNNGTMTHPGRTSPSLLTVDLLSFIITIPFIIIIITIPSLFVPLFTFSFASLFTLPFVFLLYSLWFLVVYQQTNNNYFTIKITTNGAIVG